MEKRKRWQFYLILAVVVLTFYNILPTLFYYAKPLKNPIGVKEANKIALQIVDRVDSLEDFTISWLKAQSKNLGLKPVAIALDKQNPRIATITFKKPKDAALFARTLYRAGSMIPFVPAELSPDPRSFKEGQTTVTVQRKIGVHLDPAKLNEYFRYISKETPSGKISPEYRSLINERVSNLALGFAGKKSPAKLIEEQTLGADTLIQLSRTIVDYENTFGDQSPITKRYYASFTALDLPKDEKEKLISHFQNELEDLSKNFSEKLSSLKEKESTLSKEGKVLEASETQRLKVYESQKAIIDSAVAIVKRNSSIFASGDKPLDEAAIKTMLSQASQEKVESLDLGSKNPFVSSLQIDWNKETVSLLLHPDVVAIREAVVKKEAQAIEAEKLNQLLYNEIAQIARTSDETISPTLTHFVVSLSRLNNSTSLLALDLNKLASEQIANLMSLLKGAWTPNSELSGYSFLTYENYKKLEAAKKKFAFVFYAPVAEQKNIEGFKSGSLYVIAKNFVPVMQKYKDLPVSSEKTTFEADLKDLADLMRSFGFISYQGEGAFKNDMIFELADFSSYLIAATRENFVLKGSKKYAVLEFTDVEERLLTLNKIETQEQEELVKWKDEYQAAHASADPSLKYDVPKPTKNIFLSNLVLSAKKYFRGDERKILKWGLDLSGGKTVRIGLKGSNNQPITDENDIKQAINELYQRVNRLGVSEVGIRQEGSSIVLDFPGSQGFSAADLIKASAMYFHVVNEKFTSNNPTLAEAVSHFLEEVWNEAVITNRTDAESINLIAWQHLGGDPDHEGEFHPVSSHAKLLYDNGLRLGGPKSPPRSSTFDDTLSQVSIFRGADFTSWEGQTNPLIFVFRNYALEGSSLTDIQAGYDPSEGNILSFGVKSSAIKGGEKIDPQDDFYSWTSQFAEEKIVGTPKENYSRGRGWRMSVILNGTIISAPTLNAALKNSARISGHFTQREINQLAADLKAGSLSFTPQILSEENVSPDLGKEQRTQGVVAAIVGVALVVIAMCIYYRFGGLVASVAVIFNLFIIWAVLQNLGAALSLPGIAGIILAVGMSVDANVLVFERIREEFSVSGRIAAAISAGYKKAFSAIVDSNLTTIIAAVILLNFDSGPIKGVALTLIIGIISSMFTSLFMTRYFFAGWVQNPNHKALKMMRLFKETKIDFLSKAKTAYIISSALIVIGLFFLYAERATILGMDFTGGYAITLDLAEKPDTNYRLQTAEALRKAGASESDFQIRELSKPNYLRIQLGTGMELAGKPFHNLEKSTPTTENTLFSYQTNPRILWIVKALEDQGLKLNPTSLRDLNLHWTEMSGQLSETMRNQAIFGLILALIAILIYVTFRFEFKYAISATIGLAHDLLITLGVLAIFHMFHSTVQIDLQVIAALMTIIGYSLNDTIIIFDRIREDIRLMRKMSFNEIVNHALNATLSRTVMTSGTTILVLLALVFIGGPSIFNFALIMTVGVAIGTLSSLFVAAPLLVYFHNREAVKNINTTITRSEG